MDRRDVLRAVGVGSAAGLSGCVGGLLGGNCGPGATEIGTLADRVEQTTESGDGEDGEDSDLIEIKGSAKSVSTETIVIADGTGRAALQTLGGGFDTSQVSSGDCVEATGAPIGPGGEDVDADVTFLVTEATAVGELDAGRGGPDA